MAHPLTGPLLGFASRLRFPTLFKITLTLMLVSWLWPFDPIPFIDEIVTALATLVLASWKLPSRDAEPPARGVEPPARESVTLEGESRRE
jgi:hypothetical protein